MNKAADAFRTIGEVAQELGVPKHVLRFWEGKFAQIRPMKRGGGRRYYRPEDMELLKGIRTLLHSNGYTIKGVQRILRDQGVEQVKAAARLVAAEAASDAGARRKRSRKGSPIAVPATPVKRDAQLDGSAVTTADAKARPMASANSVFAAIRELEIARAILLGEPLPHRDAANESKQERTGTA
jgi:DNA-binding transcriptional MerR regulator